MSKFKKFSTRESEEILENILTDLSKKIWKNSVDFSKDTWKSISKENEDTKLAFNILLRMVKGEKVSKGEKNILKKQSKDLLKITYAVSLTALSTPIALITLLFVVGSKYKFDIFPDKDKDLINKIKKEEDKLKNKL